MDLFFDIFWTLVGAVLGLLLCAHIFRRLAAPYRLKIYLSSGKVIRLSVADYNATKTNFSWTLSKWSPQAMVITDYDNIVGIKVTDRRFNI